MTRWIDKQSRPILFLLGLSSVYPTDISTAIAPTDDTASVLSPFAVQLQKSRHYTHTRSQTAVVLVLSSEQMIRNVAHRRGQVALEQFRNAIRPIYRSTEGVLPVHVGTCTLIRVGETKLCITAAHIIDQHEVVELWVGGQKGLTPLTGVFSGTSADGDRDQDKYDFSVSPVGDEFAEGLGNVAYIEPEFICKGQRQDSNHAMYTCIGYPNSQNKDMHATRREINVRMWMHTSKGRSTHDKLGPWAANTTAHLFIDFGKYAENVDGSKRSSTHPRGTSGGPVFYLGDFSDPDTYRIDGTFQPMFEGIVIKRSVEGNALIAVKIVSILHALSDAGLLPPHDPQGCHHSSPLSDNDVMPSPTIR